MSGDTPPTDPGMATTVEVVAPVSTTPVGEAWPVPVEPGSEDFPIAFRHYAAALRGTDDEVWTRWLQIQHGHRNMTMSEWRQVHDSHRSENAHWHQG